MRAKSAFLTGVLALAVAAVSGPGFPETVQEVSPNAPKYVKSMKAGGVEVRYLDFKWDPEAFATLEKGGTHPAGRRSWVLARLLLQESALKWKGKWIPVGPSLLVLNPARGTAGPTFEVRAVDMREIFVNMNVVAEPPEGETYQSAPASFQEVSSVAPLLEVSLHERAGALDLSVHYGNREATITLDR
jgi:hypothetical protein